MNIVRAKVLGFCMGVRRAVEMADAAIAAARSRQNVFQEQPLRLPIYTLGPLIHNPQVLASLSARGVEILDEVELSASVGADGLCGKITARCFAGAAVIIRAHGVSPAVEQRLKTLGASIIDATCPRVKASQNIASALAEQGYTIFLAGEKDHAEVKGMYGYAAESGADCIIVGSAAEAEEAAQLLKRRSAPSTAGTDVTGSVKAPVSAGALQTALIGQTTFSGDEYRAIAEVIKKYFPQLEVRDTICGATRDRQNALGELCSEADALVIVGGKESANTRRLLSIAEARGKKAWLVESAAGIAAIRRDALELLAEGKTLGLSAGASTPDSVIDEVEQTLL